MSHVQTRFVKRSLQDAFHERCRAVVDQIKGWGGAEKLLAGTFALGILTAGGQVFSYMRTDAAQTSRVQVDAVSAQVANVSGQMDDLKKAAEKNWIDLRTDLIQRISDLQSQLSRMNDRFDRIPKPETIQEIRSRQTEDEGRLNAALADINSLKQLLAVLQVQLQSFEKGRDIPLPRSR